MHRATGVGIDHRADAAAPGVDVTVSLGLLKAPCRVVWTLEEPRRAGWAYGTLPGHPECGEESFVVDRTGDGTVWLTITAFSRPAQVVRAGGRAGDPGVPARVCAAVRGGVAEDVRGGRRGIGEGISSRSTASRILFRCPLTTASATGFSPAPGAGQRAREHP